MKLWVTYWIPVNYLESVLLLEIGNQLYFEKASQYPTDKWVLPLIQVLDSSQINYIGSSLWVCKWLLESNDAEPQPAG